MTAPQAGIFQEGNPFQHHLEWRLKAGHSAAELMGTLKQALASEANLRGAHSAPVIGISKAVWSGLGRFDLPAELRDFTPLSGANGWHAPSTQGDLWLWVQASTMEDALDRARALWRPLAAVAIPTLDLPVFVRRENRDLTGFIDGSANPKDEQRQLAALIPNGQTGAGGSIAMTQRWVHDLARFNMLSVAEQEGIIGRTKADSIELEGDAMPADSHVSRTDVSIDGTALKIYRRSAPYGNAGEHGLHFVCFSCEYRRIQIQLERMYGLSDDGLHDRVIGYSQAVTGSYWFVPSQSTLDGILA